MNLLNRFTSIARVLDPRYPTNRAVLLLLAPAAGIAGAMALLRGSGLPETALSALFGAAAALAGWAFARELVPDMERLAFLSLLLTFGAFLTVESSSLLLLFAAQFLVRVVNRSVGLPARIVDSVFVAGLTVWATWAGPFPGLALIGALAFGLDASMKERFLRHWVFAGLCLVAAGLSLDRQGQWWFSENLSPTAVGLLSIVAFAYGLTMWRTRRVTSPADVTGKPLFSARVLAGMAVGLLSGLQALARGQAGLEAAALVWAVLASVPLGALVWPRR
ncbi:MAG: hypothetical protein OXU26_15795 [Acidobacteriota bacterium]|nr:hypothetical protein [Acidobacteriota bacterium]MDE2965372.1 hypothetical protein [Acidobacteriota bacterium]